MAVKIELKPVKEEDAADLYDLFQSMPLNENGAANSSYGLSETEFSAWLKKQEDASKGIGLKEGWVPATLYVLWIDNIPVARSSLRHWLTPALEQQGGHIGFSVGPKFRGNGYSNILLAETLKKAKAMNIERVLITNHDDNEPAWKCVEHNGGLLVKKAPDPADGHTLRYYQITL